MDGLERKTFTLSEAKLIGAENTFSGYGSIYGNEDRQGDIVDPGSCANLKAWLKDGFVSWMHKWDVPIGYPLKASQDDHGLSFDAEFHSTPEAIMAKTITRERLAAGKSMGLSIGYATLADGYENGVRHIKSYDLFEVALVSVPANALAGVTGMKAVVPFQDLPLADRDTAWDSAAADKRVREWAGAEEAPNARYARSFLWFDDSAKDKFGSYKLPYADIVDGKLTAVPKGIFGCAGALQGARGGVDIPDADVARAKGVLERWYAKMAQTFQDDDITPPWKTNAFFSGSREFMVALLDEAKALSDRRAKEGRELSTANVQKLTAVRSQLSEAMDLLTSILADKGAEAPPDVQVLQARVRALQLIA